jgi:hypothetical protein
VGIPVSPGFLNTDGAANQVDITVTAGDSFDGRVSQISLLSVYRDDVLDNLFQFAIAEGSGDLYRTPTSPQVNRREVELGGTLLADPLDATLSALWTYGDAGQNDRLFFNGTQIGDNDLADWAPDGSGLSYGPDLERFDVLSLLGENNVAAFSVASGEVPDTRESSLRPQIVALAVTAAPEPSSALLLALAAGWASFRRRRGE